MNRIAIVLNVFIASMVFAVGNDGGLENVQKQEQENGSGTESQTMVPVDVDRVQEIRQTRQAMDKDFRKQRILERKQEFDNNKTPDISIPSHSHESVKYFANKTAVLPPCPIQSS